MGYGITDQRLNILYAVNEIFPDTHGGVHSYIYETAKRLAARGHAVLILTKKISGNAPDAEVIDGVNICRYEFKRHKCGFLDQLSCIVGIRRKLGELNKRFSFDLISIHSPHAALGINLTGQAKKSPKIYTFHALLHMEELLTSQQRRYRWHQLRRYIGSLWLPIYLSLMRLIEKNGLDKCEKIITLSDVTYQNLIKIHRIPSDKIAKIPGGVDVKRFKPANDKNSVRMRLKLHPENRVLFTVRRLVPRMGLDNLIKAMPMVLRKCPDAVLLIGGEGPIKFELQELIKKLRLKDYVVLLGHISDEELPLYYQASDLFVLPTKILEGFGIVTLEALACGTPVLGTPVGGTVEILNKLDSGLLFSDCSPGAMAEKIIKYAANHDERLKIQNKCRRFVTDNYSWEKIIIQIEDFFLTVAGRKTDTP